MRQLAIHLSLIRQQGFVVAMINISKHRRGRFDRPLIGWRAGVDGAGYHSGMHNGFRFRCDLGAGPGRAWLIAEVRQYPTAPAERFGVALAGDVGEAEFSGLLAPVLDDLEALVYVASHSELIRSIGADVEQARAHFMTTGYAMGRSLSFRPDDYAASYPDLFGLFDRSEQAVRHFIDHGFAEGRSIRFDPIVYGAGYPDLARAFGADPKALTRHYTRFGHREGRQMDVFDWAGHNRAHPDAPISRRGAAAHFLASFPRSRASLALQRFRYSALAKRLRHR